MADCLRMLQASRQNVCSAENSLCEKESGTLLRYCVNSSSLNFKPSQDSVDSKSGGGNGPALKHLATIDGCGGGICTLKSREAMKGRKMVGEFTQPREEEKKKEAEDKAKEQSVG